MCAYSAKGTGTAGKPRKVSSPGTIAAFLATSHDLGRFSHPDEMFGTLAGHRALLRDLPESSRNMLILHVGDGMPIDVTNIRRMLDEQGLGHVRIELIAEPRDG